MDMDAIAKVVVKPGMNEESFSWHSVDSPPQLPLSSTSSRTRPSSRIHSPGCSWCSRPPITYLDFPVHVGHCFLRHNCTPRNLPRHSMSLSPVGSRCGINAYLSNLVNRRGISLDSSFSHTQTSKVSLQMRNWDTRRSIPVPSIEASWLTPP